MNKQALLFSFLASDSRKAGPKSDVTKLMTSEFEHIQYVNTYNICTKHYIYNTKQFFKMFRYKKWVGKKLWSLSQQFLTW